MPRGGKLPSAAREGGGWKPPFHGCAGCGHMPHGVRWLCGVPLDKALKKSFMFRNLEEKNFMFKFA